MEKMNAFVLCFLLLLPFSTYASGWPSFALPDGNFLIDKQYVETQSCPPGQGKAVDGAIIDMQELCRGYCPTAWKWVIKSDGQCRNLNNFILQKYEITHYPDDDNNNNGTVLYSQVNAFYGQKNGNQSPLQLVFISPKEHWYCVQLDPAFPVITCANDM